MLACARIGAVHSVVFGGFARQGARHPHRRRQAEGHPVGELRDRARTASSNTSRCSTGRSTLAAHKPDACLILQRPQEEAALVAGRDHDWAKRARRGAIVVARSVYDCVPVAATDPLYILYTSGTTGIPKGVVRDNGGHMVALKWSMKNLYGVEPGEVYWAASDVGWVVGHSYIVYAPLLHGCDLDPVRGQAGGHAGRRCVLARHRRARLRQPCSPRRPRSARSRRRTRRASCWRTTTCRGSVRCSSPASAPTPTPSQWAERLLKVPVIDHWWQTETGWCIAGNPLGLGQLPVKYGSATVPMPGYHIDIVDERVDVAAGEQDRLDRRQAAAAARRACRRCGSRTSDSRRATSASFPATTRPPTPASWTTTATSTS